MIHCRISRRGGLSRGRGPRGVDTGDACGRSRYQRSLRRLLTGDGGRRGARYGVIEGCAYVVASLPGRGHLQRSLKGTPTARGGVLRSPRRARWGIGEVPAEGRDEDSQGLVSR